MGGSVRKSNRRGARFGLGAVAIAAGWAAASAAQAVVVHGGEVFLQNGGTFMGGLGPYSGDTLYVGGSQAGSFELNGGSQMLLGALAVQGGLGSTGRIATVTGIGTVLQLDLQNNPRLTMSGGLLTVADGALLDARSLACSGFCGASIGAAAGSEGLLRVTGSGSVAQFSGGLMLAVPNAYGPPTDGFTFGVPGSVSRGRAEVLAGGRLVADSLSMGWGPGGGAATGQERSFAALVVDGQSSQVRLTGAGTATGANLTLANHPNAQASLSIANGGQVLLDGPTTAISAVGMGVGSASSGSGSANVAIGSGGSMSFASGVTGVVHVGRYAQGQGVLSLSGGGMLDGAWYVGVGRDGASGRVDVTGGGSLLRVNGATHAATQAAAGGSFAASIDLGRSGGQGTMNVTGGGRVEILSTVARSGGPVISIGRDAGSVGTLNVSGLNSVVQLSAASVLPGGGAGEAFNPAVNIGRQGTGVASITNGGKLLIDGQAVSTAAAQRSTVLNVGGIADTGNAVGGQGTLVVSGAGSEVAVTGKDAFIGVGRGLGSVGVMNLSDQAIVRSTVVNIGRSDGVGVLTMNNAQMLLSGQQTGGTSPVGATMTLGAGGSGSMTMANNALLRLDNASGTAGTSLGLGGAAAFPGGQGSLAMSSGARIEVAPPVNAANGIGLGGVTVGRSGTGTVTMSGSSIDVGAGSVVIGAQAGATGTVRMNDNSTLNAQWVGIGRTRDGTTGVSSNGGAGALIINTGSVVTAQTIEIGTAGYLGGTGTIVGNVINYGTFNPGNSPGTMVIQGSYSAQQGSVLVLEVESDGQGGFVTDQVIFGNGTALDLSELKVEFKFLGTTDPEAFRQSGQFDIDAFLRQQDSNGGTVALAPSVLSSVEYTASSEAFDIQQLNITPTGEVVDPVVFVPLPAVPEPGTWAMLVAGLGLVAARARRLRRGGSVPGAAVASGRCA